MSTRKNPSTGASSESKTPAYPDRPDLPKLPDLDADPECSTCGKKEEVCRAGSDQATREGVLGPERLGGYPALATLHTALQDWEDAHGYAMVVIASAAAHLDGGIDHNLTSRRALIVRVRAHSIGVEKDKNPGNGFLLVEAVVRNQSEFGPFARGWEQSQRINENIEEEVRTTLHDPTFAGVLPAALVVLDTRFVKYGGYPVFRRIGGDGTSLRARTILTDIMCLCHKSMSAGLALRPPSERGRCDPDAGTLVRRKKKWEWKFKEGWDWDTVTRGVTKTGLHPRDIWRIFYLPVTLESFQRSRPQLANTLFKFSRGTDCMLYTGVYLS
ncbi:hypothetical protein C8Q79DRAFT_1117637 [Trametes meyenii]|nr:hypothetical protein C8Q79DRAFT_1117637 [Trametes meyenii]